MLTSQAGVSLAEFLGIISAAECAQPELLVQPRDRIESGGRPRRRVRDRGRDR